MRLVRACVRARAARLSKRAVESSGAGKRLKIVRDVAAELVTDIVDESEQLRMMVDDNAVRLRSYRDYLAGLTDGMTDDEYREYAECRKVSLVRGSATKAVRFRAWLLDDLEWLDSLTFQDEALDVRAGKCVT
jgi:hypothetical protein